MSFAQSWTVPPPGRTCAATGEPLRPGVAVVSSLTGTPESHARRDYAAKAWPGPGADTIAYWATTIPGASAAPEASLSETDLTPKPGE